MLWLHWYATLGCLLIVNSCFSVHRKVGKRVFIPREYELSYVFAGKTTADSFQKAGRKTW